MKKIKKNNKINKIFITIILIVLFFVLFTNKYYAYWYVVLPANSIRNKVVNLGYWYYGVYDYDPNNRINISSGTYVARVTPTGEVKIFYCINSIAANQPTNDPLVPNTSSAVSMKYIECTKEYRNFHDYRRGDFVIDNNKVYEYNSPIFHLPNTNSAMAPGTTKRWKEDSSLTPTTDIYFKYSLYVIGDEVRVKNKRYRCIAEITNRVLPPSNGVWVEI